MGKRKKGKQSRAVLETDWIGQLLAADEARRAQAERVPPAPPVRAEATPSPAVQAGVGECRDLEGGQRLGAALSDPKRQQVIVVCREHDNGQSPCDLVQLRHAVAPEVRVVRINRLAHRGLQQALSAWRPDGELWLAAGVTRVYPAHAGWPEEPNTFFDAKKLTAAEILAQVVQAADDAVGRLRLAQGPFRTPARGKSTVTGKVVGGDSPYETWVFGDGKGWQLNLHELPEAADRLLAELVTAGMPVTVEVDEATRHVVRLPGLRPEAELAAQVRPGQVLLARVAGGQAQVAPTLTLPPSRPLTAFSEGDVLAVEVLEVDGNWQAHLSAPGEVNAQVTYLPGGPSWLAHRLAAQQRQDAELAATGLPEPVTELAEDPHFVIDDVEAKLTELRALIDRRFDDWEKAADQLSGWESSAEREAALRRALQAVRERLSYTEQRLAETAAERDRRVGEVAQLKRREAFWEQQFAVQEATIDKLSRPYTPEQLAALINPAGAPRKELLRLDDGEDTFYLRVGVRGTEFSDPEQQLRFEIQLAWSLTFDAPDKISWPIRPYVFGRDFLASLEVVRQMPRRKLLQALAEIVTHRSRQGKHTHVLDKPYRENAGAGARQVSRADGAMMWRFRLEHKTAAARRIHYWLLPDGTIEFDSCRTHDD